MDDMLTIAPRPCSRITAAAARVPFQVPLRMYRDDLVELLFRHLPQGGVPCDAGIVDHDVQGSELLDSCGDGASTSAPDVTSQRTARATSAPPAPRRRFCAFEVQVADDRRAPSAMNCSAIA